MKPKISCAHHLFLNKRTPVWCDTSLIIVIVCIIAFIFRHLTYFQDCYLPIINIVVVVPFINVVVIFKNYEYLTMPQKVSKELKISLFYPTDVSQKFPSPLLAFAHKVFLIQQMFPQKFPSPLFFLFAKLPLEKSYCEGTMPRFTGICLFHLICVTCE